MMGKLIEMEHKITRLKDAQIEQTGFFLVDSNGTEDHQSRLELIREMLDECDQESLHVKNLVEFRNWFLENEEGILKKIAIAANCK